MTSRFPAETAGPERPRIWHQLKLTALSMSTTQPSLFKALDMTELLLRPVAVPSGMR